MANVGKAKTLTLGNLKSDSSKFFKINEKTLTSKSGEQYKIRFKENIKESDIADFFTNLIKKVDYCNKQGIEFDILSTYMFGILDCCIEIPKIKGKDQLDIIAKEEALLATMLNLGLYEIILGDIGKEKVDMIMETISKDGNKELVDLLGNEQVKNLLLNDKLEISDGKNI